jgi:hypothetical protein
MRRGRRAARRSIMETATRNAAGGTAATIRPQAVGWAWARMAARLSSTPPALLLVALPLAGGHHAGQVDADRHGPGHRAALAVLGGGVADVGERPGPGDDREHGDGQGVGDREQAPARAHEPSGRPPRPGRPGGPSPPRPCLARLPLCRDGAAPVNAEFFTPRCLLNARPALTLPAATVAPATRERRAPGRPGRNSLHLQKSGFGGPFSLSAPNQVAEGQD